MNITADEVALKCECGAVTGTASLHPAGRHLVCMCQACQAYAHFLDRSDSMLDDHGGTDIYQLTPSQVHITQGQDQLRCMRLSEKGVLRWYTACCKTPIANTLAGAGIPFVGMPTMFMQTENDEQLGPVRHYIHAGYANGEPVNAHQSAPPVLLLATAVKMLVNSLRGLSKPTPFFDGAGAPVVEPEVLGAQERTALGLPAQP